MSEATPTPRELARAETIEQIKAIARDHLAVDGPAGLSLRAVARDLGMVSSAVYRYFASREELLTALIVDGFEALGEAVEQAEGGVTRRSVAGRWQALARATRDWALEHPQEYALVFGGVLPGFETTEETLAAANRSLAVLAALLADGVTRGVIEAPSERLPAPVRAEVVALAEALAEYAGSDAVPPALMARALGVWSQLHGVLGFELSGHYTGALGDPDAWFDQQLRSMSRQLGLGR